ncbi:MAG: hypothetical protein V1773_01645 [bacterium]
MIKSVLFKEWLKTKWAFLGLLAFWLIVIVYIYIDISHQLKFYEASTLWYNIVFMGYTYYAVITYIPLLAGLLLGLTQFVPEITEKRLKLTLHLPVKENKMLFTMIGVGGGLLLILYIFSLAGLIIVSSIFFPLNITQSMLITMAPWYFAGIVVYFSSAMIILEPIWLRRILYLPIVFGFIDLLLEKGWYNLYHQSLLTFLLLSLVFIFSVLITGYRFKRGAMK